VALNADMIGHTLTEDGKTRFRTYATQDISWLLNTMQNLNSNHTINFNLTQGITGEEGRGGSDYFSFIEYGYETVAFFEYEWNQNMHSPADDLDNVDLEYLVNTTKLIIATMAYLGDYEITEPQIRISSPQKGTLYFEGYKRRSIQDLKTIVIDDIWIWADIYPASTVIDRVEFYYDGKLDYTDTEPPFKWHLNKRSIKKHRISVIAYDHLGKSASAWQDIHYYNPRINE